MVRPSLEEIYNFQTPFYLFDAEHLNNQIDSIRSAFNSHWANYILSYSVKTNNLPSLSKEMLCNGVFAEVVSKDEYDFIKSIGYTSDLIVANGPIKSNEWVCELLENETIINVDSKKEIEFICQYAQDYPLKTVKIGLRINLYLEDAFPKASTAGNKGSRFGFSEESGELSKVFVQIAKFSNIKINGLHLHASTNLRTLEVYKFLCNRFSEIVEQYKLFEIEYLDLGGGFYGEVPNKPGWNEYVECFSSTLRAKGFSPDSLKLIIEPGVSLLAGCFSYYAKVLEVKHTLNSCFVQLDGTRLHVDPLLHKDTSQYFFDIISSNNVKKENPTIPTQYVVGNTCLEYDSIIELLNHRKLSYGDVICFNKIGAYTISFIPLFISWFPIVYKYKNGEYSIARKRWTTVDFLQNSVL